MKTAIILHGWDNKEEFYDPSRPNPSNTHWLPWLQKRLLVNEIYARTPQMPDSHTPEYSKWKREFERFDIDEETILVGHSCGGGFLVRWMSENPDVRVGKVILVAPWIDPNHVLEKEMFDFDINPEIVNQTENLILFSSEDDMHEVETSVQQILKVLPGVEHKRFKGKGHFTLRDLGTCEFPELLDVLI